MTDPHEPTEEPIDRWKPQRASTGASGSSASLGEHADELPGELNATGFVGPYLFPDNKRRRIAGWFHVAAGALLLVLWGLDHQGGVLVDRGFLAGGVAALALGAYHQLAGYPLKIKDLQALTAASSTVGFPIGHTSAQLGWRGLRSRPTWRILLYSADDPPTKRGLVLVDGVEGVVVDHFVEDNPEDWSQFDH